MQFERNALSGFECVELPVAFNLACWVRNRTLLSFADDDDDDDDDDVKLASSRGFLLFYYCSRWSLFIYLLHLVCYSSTAHWRTAPAVAHSADRISRGCST